jgi:hypothetical protein
MLQFAAAHASEGIRAVALEAMARCGITTDLTPTDALYTFVSTQLYSLNPAIRSLATGALGFFTWRPVLEDLPRNAYALPAPLAMAFDSLLAGSPRTQALVPILGFDPLRLPLDIYPGICLFVAQLVPAMPVVVERLLVLVPEGGATEAYQKAIESSGMVLAPAAVHETLALLFVTAPSAGMLPLPLRASALDAFFAAIFTLKAPRHYPLQALEVYSLLQTCPEVVKVLHSQHGRLDWGTNSALALFHGLIQLASTGSEDGFSLYRMIGNHITRGVAAYPGFAEAIIENEPILKDLFSRPAVAPVLQAIVEPLKPVTGAMPRFADVACTILREVLERGSSMASCAITLRPVLLAVPEADYYKQDTLHEAAKRCAQESAELCTPSERAPDSALDLLALGALCVRLHFEASAAQQLLQTASMVNDVEASLVLFKAVLDKKLTPVTDLPPFPPDSTSSDRWVTVSGEVAGLVQAPGLRAKAIAALITSLLLSRAARKEDKSSLWQTVRDKVAGLESLVLSKPTTLVDLTRVLEALGTGGSDEAKAAATKRWAELKGSNHDSTFKTYTQQRRRG